MTIVHRHGNESFHSHSDEEHASHEPLSDGQETSAGENDFAMYAGHSNPGAPEMIAREDTPRSLAEEEAAVQDTPAAEALRDNQERGYAGQDAADLAGGVDELREDLGAKKEGPGAPDYPPGHPEDPTVPPSAGTTSTGDGS